MTMIKIVVALMLFSIQCGITLGNFWVTFRLWPRSWIAFLGFAVAQMIVYGVLSAIAWEKK